MKAGKCISIIVPMYNEEANVAAFFEQINLTIAKIRSDLGFRIELIVNDNCSSDGTFELLEKHYKRHDPKAYDLRIFRFSRNVGFQRSILAGYYKSRGDAVVQIDADLQDSPDMILAFIENWQAGYEVVYGIREKRREGRMNSFLRNLYYKLVNAISKDDLPVGAGDFRLIDRKLVDVICAMRDYDPYLRGAIASLGFSQKGIPYARNERTAGETSFGFFDLLKLSLDGISNHSVFPLRMAIYLSFAISILTAFLSVIYLVGWIFSGNEYPRGFATLVLMQLGGLGILSFLIGVQGEYVGRMFRQSKEGPLAIVERKMELTARNSARSKTDSEVEVLWFGENRKGSD
jgi:dolichol-phosphate mannosyltransferase